MFSQKDYKGTEYMILESVLGFRQWSWLRNSLIGTMAVDWNKGSLEAVCKRYSTREEEEVFHSSPDAECQCGIYAHYLPLESYPSRYGVFGVVEASGRILMGTRGFRTEKAKIVALAGFGEVNQWFEVERPGDPDTTRGIIDFATSIGVPYFPTVEKMVQEFPQKDLSSLGVPDLKEWQDSIPEQREKQRIREEQFKIKAEENRKRDQARMDYYRMLNDTDPTELLRSQYGDVSQRMIDTYKHLGGYQ